MQTIQSAGSIRLRGLVWLMFMALGFFQLTGCNGEGGGSADLDPSLNETSNRIDVSDAKYILRESYFVDLNTSDAAGVNERSSAEIVVTDERGTYTVDFDRSDSVNAMVDLVAFRDTRETAILDNDLNVCGDNKCNRAYLVVYTDGEGNGYWNSDLSLGLPISFDNAIILNTPSQALVLSGIAIDEDTDSLSYGDLVMPFAMETAIDFSDAQNGAYSTSVVFEYVLTYAAEDDDGDPINNGGTGNGTGSGTGSGTGGGTGGDTDGDGILDDVIDILNSVATTGDELLEDLGIDTNGLLGDTAQTVTDALSSEITSPLDGITNASTTLLELHADVSGEAEVADWIILDAVTGEIVWQVNDTPLVGEILLSQGNFVGDLLGETSLDVDTDYIVLTRVEDLAGNVSHWSDVIEFHTQGGLLGGLLGGL